MGEKGEGGGGRGGDFALWTQILRLPLSGISRFVPGT